MWNNGESSEDSGLGRRFRFSVVKFEDHFHLWLVGSPNRRRRGVPFRPSPCRSEKLTLRARLYLRSGGSRASVVAGVAVSVQGWLPHLSCPS